MRLRTKGLLLFLLVLLVFLGWRFVRPLNIFTVTDAFERPVSTAHAEGVLSGLSAEDCAVCHRDFFAEWRTSMHSQAWTDPYFQVDWQFDGSQQICKNCHIPLDRQQEDTVLGFRDQQRWDPVLSPNPDFDPKLQHEGVTCTACHLRDGRIVGVLGIEDAPHPVAKIEDPNLVCVRCHVVEGERWDTFFRFPPCGTVAEIQANPYSRLTAEPVETLQDFSGAPPDVPLTDNQKGSSGEVVLQDTSSLGCVQCHMPLVQRPLVEGGAVRAVRRHLWRGGHDPEMVKSALEARFEEVARAAADARNFVLTLTNVGAAHYLPTGTPDRFLSIDFSLLDREGRVLKTQHHTARRTIIWRPIIIDLRDTRLPRWQPRSYEFSVPVTSSSDFAAIQAVVRYHLLDEKRRKRIGYDNKEPIAYDVFRQVIPLAESARQE